jgi:CRISPR-associated protein Csd2
MAVQELIIFKHDSEFGCAPAHKLFDRVQIRRRDPQDLSPARSYQDYIVELNESELPNGVTCIRMR